MRKMRRSSWAEAGRRNHSASVMVLTGLILMGADAGESSSALTLRAVGVRRGHGGEVVRAEQEYGGLRHGVERERPAAVPGVGREEGRADALERGLAGREADASLEDAVLVGFAAGAVAGVEARRDRFAGEDANAGREDAVECAMKIGCRDGGRRRKLTTCASAWTPASVRPEPCGSTRSPVIRGCSRRACPGRW